MALRNELADSYRRDVFLVSILSSVVAVGMVGVRVLYSGQMTFVFLVWNLFLAWIPFVFSLQVVRSYQERARISLMMLLYGFVWLIFFPNAPYIVTDFLHLQARAPVPLWYDLILLFSFAWAGLFMGFTSLYLMQRLVTDRFGPLPGWCFALGVLGLGSFGIYLGRFLGWNSWDVLADPKGLLADVLSRVAHPLAHPQTLGFSFLLTVVLAAVYLALFSLTRLPRVPERGESSGMRGEP